MVKYNIGDAGMSHIVNMCRYTRECGEVYFLPYSGVPPPTMSMRLAAMLHSCTGSGGACEHV